MRNLTILLLLSLSFGTVTDIDGNVYETVQIGEQLWMAENLKVTHYNNGDEIPTGYSNSDWTNLSIGAYAVYDNDPANAETYGRLYNWYTVDDDRGVCPEGFHVPSEEEIEQLEMYLGISEEDANSNGWRGTDEGSQLAGNSDLWNDGNLVNNSEFGASGFTLLPAGFREGPAGGGYIFMGRFGYFWSSSEPRSTSAWHRKLFYDHSTVFRDYIQKRFGISIRCLSDELIETGCTDPEACNYNPDATVDDGSCEYYNPEIMCDCAGSFLDVNGDCCSELMMDECWVCNGDGPAEHHDCDGNCLVEFDCAGNCCVLGEEGCYWQETGPCGEEGPNNGTDSCGVCGGDNSSCADCSGVPCSNAYIDNCGICDDDPSNDCVQGCDDMWGSGMELDECGVCDGDGSSCADSDNDGCLDNIDDAPYEWDDDYDGDSLPDDCDADDDNDGAADASDSDDNNEFVCSDNDGDTCDDCSAGYYDPSNDGPDWNANGICDAGDGNNDTDGDGVIDDEDSDPYNPYQCADSDSDSCDDCSTGHYDPSDDGLDYDGDGICNAGDPDDDNDGAEDYVDLDDNNEFVCSDNDGDTCNDCSAGYYDPSNDGEDYDADGLCNLGDMDDDNDGVVDSEDCAPLYELASEFDCAGICGGDNSTYDNCCGTPPGPDCTDDCVMDEEGNCCLTDDLDDCGICGGDNACYSCEAPFIDIDGHCLHENDIAVLQQFIDNSLNSGYVIEGCDSTTDPWCSTPNLFMDQSWHDVVIDGINYQFANQNGVVEPLELGLQDWVDGRLISIMCGAYIYCQLSGEIPESVSELSEIEVLRLEVNYFTGDIPESVCELENINFSDDLAFDFSYNMLCPPYPDCVEESAIQFMDTSECWQNGDVNYDGSIDVLDVVVLVHSILNELDIDGGDINADNSMNVLDIVMLVNIIIEG